MSSTEQRQYYHEDNCRIVVHDVLHLQLDFGELVLHKVDEFSFFSCIKRTAQGGHVCYGAVLLAHLLFR